MASEPSEEAIASFTSITNTSREQAISFLKANDLDASKAINAYFEDPTGPQLLQPTAYQNEPTASAYQIEHSDAVPVSPNLIPPSRPPSAMNMKDTTHAPELPPPQVSTQDTKETSGNSLTLAEQEERQLQQAVAMSLNQNLGQQETGVTNSNQKFGRATRDHYDEGAWAMTLFNSSSREIIISPDPVNRKRQASEPAFIRPSQDGLHLSGLLTILHSIPLAREALLLRNRALSSYGHDAQWWNGQPINLPKVVTIHEAQDGDTDWDDILHEAQRIMAFLDSTTRAFGSADALAGLKSMSTYDAEGSVSRFLEAWQESAVRTEPGNQLTTVFMSMAYKRPLAAYDTPIDKEFYTLEPYVESVHGQTLYDVLDGTMWADSPGEELDDVWLEHIADILVVRLDNTDSEAKAADVKVPATFYPDRYLASCRDISRDYRVQRLEVREDIVRLQHIMDRLSVPKGLAKGFTSQMVLEKAADAAAILGPKGTSGDEAVSTAEPGTDVQKLAAELRAFSQKIEGKLKELEERKQQALESLRGSSKFLTEPSDTPGEPPVHKYTLRGVCTEPHVTYVLRRRIPDPETPPSDDYDWWRISFSVDDAKTRQAETGGTSSAPKDADVIGYTAHKVREVEVLRAAREESKNVLLVYANSNAMNFKEEPVPPTLQAFVDADNAAFDAELLDWENNAEARQQEQEQEVDWEQTFGSRPAYPSPSIREEGTSEGIAARNVNVFDYQVSSFDDDSATEPGQEMQERTGRSLLSQGAVQPGPGQGQNPQPAWDQP
ncbi:hypothetical protein BJX62DRAFT_214713 [Aspergillus germanicus]